MGNTKCTRKINGSSRFVQVMFVVMCVTCWFVLINRLILTKSCLCFRNTFIVLERKTMKTLTRECSSGLYTFVPFNVKKDQQEARTLKYILWFNSDGNIMFGIMCTYYSRSNNGSNIICISNQITRFDNVNVQ